MFAVFDAYPMDLTAYSQRFEGVFPPEVLLRLSLSILDSLMFLDENGIAHWDVKLDNFLMSSCGVAFLADLGEALLGLPPNRCFKLHRNQSAGNQSHRAPEVLNALVRLKLCEEVDVDLSGQAVFEAAMIVGKPPFQL
jgi:serine/threonine protein kinase